MQQGNKSPKQILDECKSMCEQSKQQLVQQMNQIPDPQARTAAQMAVNTLDHCIAQCHTASGVVQ